MTKTQKITIPIISILLIYVIIRIAYIYTRKPMPEPEPVPGPVPSAAEETAQRTAERMNDKEYMAGLKQLETYQIELAKERNDANVAYQNWYRGFLASNETAKAILVKASVGQDGLPQDETVAVELAKLAASDPVGASLRAKCAAVETAVNEHQKTIKAFIGDKLRKQAQERAEKEGKKAGAPVFGSSGPSTNYPSAKINARWIQAQEEKRKASEKAALTVESGTNVIPAAVGQEAGQKQPLKE